MVGYTAYICAKTDAHGVECGFVFNEITGLTYQKGDYYYDSTDGTVKVKEADDTEPTYGAYTRFFDAIATPVVKNGNRYIQPDSKHFVCPECGEPILDEDWAEHDDWDVCPICGFNFWEG
jgi:predicted RNA-binding Zn-ribbon protein involved in translation (DUF1610 family)